MQVTPHHPDLMNVALQAQNMAKSTQQERLAFAFQSVAMVSMALMGITAAAHNIGDLLRSEKGGRGR